MNSIEINTLLKEKGLRKTRIRKAIVAELIKSDRPLDIDSLQKKLLKKNVTPNLSTIYREMNSLEGSKIVEMCGVFGKKEYQLKTKGNIAHCLKCNKTCRLTKKDVVEIRNLQKELRTKNKFHIFTPNTHIHGFCSECQC